jgi:hypothetical protein
VAIIHQTAPNTLTVGGVLTSAGDEVVFILHLEACVCSRIPLDGRLLGPQFVSIMAEALGLYVGIVASIGTLLQLSEIVIEYIRNTAGAENEMKELLIEVTATRKLLAQLQEAAKAPEWKNTVESLEEAGGPLDVLKSSLKELETKATNSKKGFKNITKRLIWHFEKGELESILAKIERGNSRLNTALNLYSLCILLP